MVNWKSQIKQVLDFFASNILKPIKLKNKDVEMKKCEKVLRPVSR